ncbi:MAG: hypothetical protein BHW65_04165 [Verrucomicrobia bacterium CAG:312_58_20]|nr:MAG: hypothetical protein BHW65_04165 [Verrucomicrobia bacterium CAG:312_58_20]
MQNAGTSPARAEKTVSAKARRFSPRPLNLLRRGGKIRAEAKIFRARREPQNIRPARVPFRRKRTAGEKTGKSSR